MNLELNDDQQLLLDTIDAAVGRSYDKNGGRAAATTSDLGWSSAAWSTLAELGITGLTVSEINGGAGAGPVELYASLEGLGRHAAAEPILDCAALPSWLIEQLATPAQAEELLAPLTAGESIVTLAHAEPGRAFDTDPSARIVVSGGSATLSGVKSPVPHADHATKLLVTAVDEAGKVQVVVVDANAAGVARNDGRGADWSHASEITFSDAPATLLGDGTADATSALRTAFARARIAVTGEAVGLMESSLHSTVEYLKSRKQFGVTLSTFQALVHRAADLYARVELARSMALRATALAEAAAEGHEVDLGVVADDAFVFVSDSAIAVAEESIQLHGGIGMTYESEIGHHAARLVALTSNYGGVESARRRAITAEDVLRTPSALLNNDTSAR